MSGYYDSEDDLDIHVSRRRAPSPVHYVEARPPPRARQYYPNGPGYLAPDRTIITTRSRSRERSRERRSSSPSIPPPLQPVIINNRIYNEHSSDEEDDRRQIIRSRRRSHSRSRSSSYMTRDDYEMERTRRELDELKLIQAREKEERRAEKDWKDDAELKRAKRELDEIKRKEALAEEEKRIKSQLELQRLREEERQEEEKKHRDKAAKEAVEKYKQKEAERIAKETLEKQEQEKEYRRRLQEDLINSGLDEKQIAAILKKEKVTETNSSQVGGSRPTYTRMARRHLSIETLRTFRIEYDLDQDPEYILIKRWVPEWEQDTLWKHTKFIREKRSKVVLAIEDGHHKKHHHHHEPDFEWVRKKERKRSKSPALLMYLAGARPS